MSTDAIVFPSPRVIEELHPKPGIRSKDTQKISNNPEMMTPMNESALFSEDIPLEPDDLEQIKGIGPAYAQTLLDLGICTFEQLAKNNSKQLAKLLRKHNIKISPQVIANQNWIGQAQVLALAKQGTGSEAIEPDTQNETREAKQPKSVKVHRQKNWRELADFWVSFGYAIDADGQEQLQTKVNHDQGNCDEKWEGISIQQLIQWMVSQADLPVTSDLEDFLRTGDRVDEFSEITDIPYEAQLEILDLWIHEVQGPREARDTESLALLQTEARLVLSGSDAIDLTSNENPFTFDIYLVNTENQQTELVASSSGTLMPGEMEYEIQKAFQVPPVGRYQLTIVAQLLPPAMIVTHLQGPIIRVEPTSKKTPQL